MNIKSDFESIRNDLKKRVDKTMSDIGGALVNSIRDNFDNEGIDKGYGVVKWKRSKAAEKRVNSGRTKNTTLVDTGNLRKSIKFSYSNYVLKVGIPNSSYGVAHDLGRGTVRRQFLFFRKDIAEKVVSKNKS